MKVVVDALSARTGGGVTYLRSLLGGALEADPALELVIVAGERAALAPLEATGRVRIVEPLGPGASLARRLAWQQIRLPRLARGEGADAIFSPSEIAPVRSTTPVVLGFQNPNLYERPEPFAKRRQLLRLRLLREAARISARRAAALVFVSDPFRRIALASLGVSTAIVRTVAPGIDPIFTPDGPPGFTELRPYVLSVSDLYPYKNFTRLIDAFALLERPELRLVIAGRPVDPAVSADLHDRIRRHGLEERVLLLGSVPLEEMPALYRGAECFVFPSLLESFGFPPLEAMACGIPVACARASVMPEVCGDAPLYFDPYERGDIAAATERLLVEPALAREHVERGAAHAATFGWDTAGRALVDAFRAVSGSRGRQS